MHYDSRIRNCRILIVDDVIANVSLLENVLHRMGYKELRAVTDAREVMGTIIEWEPDLIVLDLAMPHINGLQILDLLRDEESRDDTVPVLVLTADTDPATKRRALAAGATEFLPKPFDSSEIMLRIRNLLLMRILHGELKSQNRLLEENVAARTKTLSERTMELEQAMAELKAAERQVLEQERFRAFGEMAAGIAHDFNNVLIGVIGYTDLILNDHTILKDESTVLEFMKAMNTAGQDAARMIARLREFYRKRDECEILIPADLNKLIEEVIPMTQPKWKAQALAAGRDIEMELDLSPLPTVSCNPAEIREVVVNLIFNAVDAMPKGGKVTLRTRISGDEVSFGVTDTGTGMSEEVRKRCMEPFFSTKGEHGTGLGLAMVFGIVKRHQGNVRIESELGEGTTIWVTLRAATDEAALPEDDEKKADRALRILTVDDEPCARDVLRRYLNADGHDVVIAANGYEAMEKFQDGEFDLVITDHVMPGMTGAQLASTIRSAAPEQPIILLTGYSDPAFDTAQTSRGVDMVSKTISQKELRRAINRVFAPKVTV